MSLKIFGFAPEPVVLSGQTHLSPGWRIVLGENFDQDLVAGLSKSLS
jgi:hypothetical protein